MVIYQAVTQSLFGQQSQRYFQSSAKNEEIVLEWHKNENMNKNEQQTNSLTSFTIVHNKKSRKIFQIGNQRTVVDSDVLPFVCISMRQYKQTSLAHMRSKQNTRKHTMISTHVSCVNTKIQASIMGTRHTDNFTCIQQTANLKKKQNSPNHHYYHQFRKLFHSYTYRHHLTYVR